MTPLTPAGWLRGIEKVLLTTPATGNGPGDTPGVIIMANLPIPRIGTQDSYLVRRDDLLTRLGVEHGDDVLYVSVSEHALESDGAVSMEVTVTRRVDQAAEARKIADAAFRAAMGAE